MQVIISQKIEKNWKLPENIGKVLKTIHNLRNAYQKSKTAFCYKDVLKCIHVFFKEQK